MSNPDEPYAESVFFLILNFARRTRATLEKQFEEIDISIPEYVALMVLNTIGPLSNASLARRCHISPQAMIKVTAGLAKSGLIRRDLNVQERQHLLALTAEGQERVGEIVTRLKKTVQRFTATTSDEEYREFKRLLGVYWRALEDAPDGIDRQITGTRPSPRP